MKTNTSGPRMWWALGMCALVLLIMVTIGTALAAVPSTTAYHFSSHPMISGTVVSVNDRQMVVDTDQGEQVALEVDTRTMAPRDLAPGMVMRVEFLALEDCRFYAQRVMPIRSGMPTSRLQAYAITRGVEPLASDLGSYRRDRGEIQVSAKRWEGSPPSMEHSSGRMMTATPTTADYLFSTRPMISGQVLLVNDHRLVVETDQGQKVGMVMDSHTMVPGEIAPGAVMRAEFTPMKDGRYYAKRVSQIGNGVVAREQAYAHTRDSEWALAQDISDCGFTSAPTRNTMTSAVEGPRAVATPDPVVAQPVSAQEVERPATLPQTGSSQPLILLLGFFALGSAGIVTVVRDLRKA